MIEAVGERYWPDYFAALDRLLAPGGRVGLQSIVMPHRPHARHPAHPHLGAEVHLPRRPDPVGHRDRATTPPAPACGWPAGTTSAATTRETLRIWRERFCARAAELAGLGFDDVFRRMWLLYLCYAEAGFRSGYLDVSQFLLVKEGS